MSKRIPDKVTDRMAYHRYWRDKRMLQDMNAFHQRAVAISLETDDTRAEYYRAAVKALGDAVEHFAAGWNR